ncbi:MAG: galactokinase family protein [Oscillospiraceae bacterium]|nr:galactokinase family protein [Oscillospiraceae bacterium]
MLKINEAISLIEQGKFDTAFGHLYTNHSNIIEKQRRRYMEAINQFAAFFGTEREITFFSTPGRTEIGGNHTDHNHGIVMAAAVSLDIIGVVSLNSDTTVRVKSEGFDNMDVVDISDLSIHENEKGRSSALVRGVAAGIVQRGGKIGGFDAYTTSDVLRGSGLSSSAAFEVEIGAVFNGLYNNNKFSPVEIAQISQYAENVYFGKPSGLMDQTACSCGSAITIDFKNPENPIVENVSFDLEQYGFNLCITDTKGSHADLTEEYGAIRFEMEEVAAFFGKKVLREVDETAFFANIAQVRTQTGDRAVLRAIHFFADCNRAVELCNAVRENRFEDFLKLIIEGGHSSFEYNQNAYAVKKPTEQGVALGVAVSQKVLNGKGAWRLQGGGFAGTIQAFVPNSALEEYIAAVESVFGANSCYVLSVRNYGAVEVTQSL